MKTLSRGQNQRIKAARKEFLAARWKYKQTVYAIRKENKKGHVAPYQASEPTTIWDRLKKGVLNVFVSTVRRQG